MKIKLDAMEDMRNALANIRINAILLDDSNEILDVEVEIDFDKESSEQEEKA